MLLEPKNLKKLSTWSKIQWLILLNLHLAAQIFIYSAGALTTASFIFDSPIEPNFINTVKLFIIFWIVVEGYVLFLFHKK